MSWKATRRSVFGLLLVVVVSWVIWTAAVFVVAAQKAERGTVQWQIHSGGTFGDVTVIDTSGVCIYTFRTVYGTGIAAVPKTQLPAGTGCQ